MPLPSIRAIRELRVEDTLFTLSVLIILVSFTGVAPHISTPISGLFLLILSLSIILHVKKITISNWIINVLSVILLLYPLLGFTLEDIVMPSVEALTLITSVRFLGKKGAREYLQIYLLSVLLLGASTLFDISWSFLIRLIILFLLCLFSVLLLTYFRETSQSIIDRRNLIDLLKYAVIIAVLSIPISFIFFFILPRTPNPLLDVGLAKSKTGFTSTVSLGSVSSIEEDRSVVMRVYMKPLEERALYWRMITFDTFTGTKWLKEETIDDNYTVKGQKIQYTISFEPSFENYLPALDYPSMIFLRGVLVEEPAIFKTNFTIDRQIKYTAESYLNFVIEESIPSKVYLQLPDNLSERFKRLTEDITKGAVNEEEIALRILNFLNSYDYSLKELPKGNAPVDDFLFNTKKGNCEYFATSMALMLRFKGIPARVVGGFRGGSYNNLGGYYIVRASDAHLWVEAWLSGKWSRFDPSGTRVIRTSEPFILNLIDYIWSSYVINYDFKSQLKLFQTLRKPDLKLKKELLIIPLFLIFIILLIKLVKHQNHSRTPLYRFLKILKKAGYERERTEGLEEFVSKISDSALREKSLEFVQSYYNIYFRDKKPSKLENLKFNQLLEEIDEIIKGRRVNNR